MKPTFRAVARQPVYVQVADQIRDAILDGRLVTGQELPSERELATQFRVSRSTVREALRVLHAQGFFRTDPSTPFRPIVNDASNVLVEAFDTLLRGGRLSPLDLIQFRCILELQSVGMAVIDPNRNQWDEASEALGWMQAAIDSVEEFVDAYVRFHLAVARGSGNDAVALTMEATQAVLDDHLRTIFHDVADGPDRRQFLTRLHREHVELLDTLRAGDASRARELISGQLSGFYNQVLATQAFPHEERIPGRA
jgi:DNA-binding FadR family transcriptional regulator